MSRTWRHPNKTFTYATLKSLVWHSVYAWKRGRTYLYVGVSSNLLRRISGHNVIGKAEPMQEKDCIVVWYARSLASATRFAARLQARYKPKYSVEQTSTGERLCLGCHTSFIPKRPWQKFHEPACRRTASRYR